MERGVSKGESSENPKKPSHCSNTRCDKDCNHPFRHRASAAWVKIDGVPVVEPRDLSHGVATLTRVVSLKPVSTLSVTIAGAPGSNITLRICGSQGAAEPPQIGWASPAAGSTTNDATPLMVVRYQAAPGGAALDLTSFAVTLDGVDRSALFTKGASEATAELPAALAEGSHQAQASIKDTLGTAAVADLAFSVDVTPPTLEITAPSAAYATEAIVPIRIAYADNLGLDLTSLAMTVDGQDRTAELQKTANGASADLTLAAGAHAIQAQVRDAAGNASPLASRQVTVDLQGPSLSIVKPEGAVCTASESVDVLVEYADDQSLDLGSLKVLLDGQPLPMSEIGPARASTVAAALANGSHRLAASIADQAGHVTTAPERSFCVDTQVPVVHIETPAAGVPIAEPQPPIRVSYSDNDGVEPTSFVLSVSARGASRTATCEAGDAQATCALAEPLPDGDVEIRAEIKDHAGNAGHDVAAFTVDTAAPTGEFTAPAPVVERRGTPCGNPLLGDRDGDPARPAEGAPRFGLRRRHGRDGLLRAGSERGERRPAGARRRHPHPHTGARGRGGQHEPLGRDPQLRRRHAGRRQAPSASPRPRTTRRRP